MHNMNLLGLRGQAKTRIAGMTQLLDEYVPTAVGSELNDDPLNPISKFAIEHIQEHVIVQQLATYGKNVMPKNWRHLMFLLPIL